MDPNTQPKPGGSKIGLIIIIVVVALLIGGGLYYWFGYRTKVVTGPDGYALSVAENGSSAKKPANFPKNIPVYPKATYSSFTTGDEGSSYGASTADSVETVVNWFKTELPKNGWKADAMNANLISISQGDQVGNINVSSLEGKSQITFSVVPKSALPEGYDQTLEEQKSLLKDMQSQ